MMEQLFPRTHQTKVNVLNSHIFLITFLVSLLLSIISYANLSPINKDGALYLQAAETFLESGFFASAMQYSWPFYSILIALLSQILHLSLLTTAYLINTLLMAGACSMFVAVIKRIGGNSTTLILAAITILSYWFFNTSRNDVLRDYGYWFFYLSAIYFLLKFCDKPKWGSALAWNLSIIFAILFRPESIVFLVVPLILLMNQEWTCKEKFRYQLKINFLLFLMFFASIAFLLFSIYKPIYLQLLIDFGFTEFKQIIYPVFEKFIINKKIIADSILNDYSSRHASATLIAMIVTLVFITFFNVIGVIYFLLAGFGLINHVFPKNDNARKILISFLVINFAMLFTFVGANYFLSKRYAAGAALIVLTLIPYTLEKLSKHRKIFTAVIAIMVIAAIPSIVHLKHDKNDIIIAGKWIESNSPAKTLIATNDRRIAFYAHRKMIMLIENEDMMSYLKYHYVNTPLLALRFTEKDKTLEKQALMYLKTPDKVIENKKEKVLIYINREKISK